ncbi:hypothetical protein [Deinococcus yavapaiensis]|uniref:Uncharacterized protein n=1 Tax=Deinococcus yavapaiensis KR-236 TaxID=694435 RepID=A0A318RYQ8_9DEIO|nr:hypothetical protein [Deinococcus yavapaiensis]PYE48359.1 hypothetical protein DES52_1302 [Deinococcus yavapaiensis KR-236]
MSVTLRPMSQRALLDVSAVVANWMQCPKFAWDMIRARGWLKRLGSKLPPLYVHRAFVIGVGVGELEEALGRAERNGPGVFLAFVRAAFGRVRHSIRWRTARKYQNRRAEECRFDKTVDRMMTHAPIDDRGSWEDSVPLSERRERMFLERQRRLLSKYDKLCPETKDFVRKHSACLMKPFTKFGPDGTARWNQLRVKVAQYCRSLQDRNALKRFFEEIFIFRRAPADALALALKHHEQANFRAFLAKKVKRSLRCACLPRPVYTIPIPPSAPLAPPVA